MEQLATSPLEVNLLQSSNLEGSVSIKAQQLASEEYTKTSPSEKVLMNAKSASGTRKRV